MAFCVNIAEKVFKHNKSSINLVTLARLKFEFNAIISHKAEFPLFRAWQKLFVEGDKAGRMLARYIKEKEALSSIPALRVQGDVLLTHSGKINGAFRDFYISSIHLSPKLTGRNSTCF